MICKDIWDQHREKYSVAGCELRFLRYRDYVRISAQAGITAMDLAFMGRLGLKRKAGVEAVTPPEEMREQAILAKWPVLETYAACFVQPCMEDGRKLEAWLYSLPRDDRLTLELWLERLTEQTPSGVYGLEDLPLIGAVGLQIAKDLDFSNVTLQQALVLFGTIAAAAQAARQGQQPGAPGGP